MDTYLISVSLGPVQSLIAAARKTRDLWCGSWLLSEASRAAARVLHEAQPGCLIFPCPDEPADALAPRPRPVDEANIANVLRAQILADDPSAVRALAQAAREAAEDRLRDLCAQARAEVPKLPIHVDLWDAQTRDILECFAGWVRVDDGYANASRRLGATLAARKSTRDCSPAATRADGKGVGIPKSSLDGARESVIDLTRQQRSDTRYKTVLRQLGLAVGEHLDALGVAKRRAGIVEQFTAYSRIAADPWIERLSNREKAGLSQAYEELRRLGLATGVSGNGDVYKALPYDAQCLFEFRLDNALTQADADSDDKRALKQLRRVLIKICDSRRSDGEKIGAPVPYAAILKADGDRMGELLSAAQSPEQSRLISKALHGFATSVRGLVRNHRGHAIYAGGDDVLALVPLPGAIPCAKALATAFEQAMSGPAQALLGRDSGRAPTLSVGIGVGHLMEPLGALRARADAAEHDAKGNNLAAAAQRNAVAVRLGIRSGGELTWRARWADEHGNATSALADMQTFVNAFRDGLLPSRIPYDLRAIGGQLAWLDDANLRAADDMRRAEVQRTLDRARTDGGGKTISAELRQLLAEQAATLGLRRLADQLIIARWLSARSASELGITE
jgi:CRISPR-associated protein Cmr2